MHNDKGTELDSMNRLRVAETRTLREALQNARASALEEAAKDIELIGQEWEGSGQMQKQYAAKYLAAYLRKMAKA